MKIDIGSFAYNIKVVNSGGTPSWGTALGQDGKYYISGNYSDLTNAMVYNAIPDISQIEIPLGKGGKQRDKYLFSIAAKFTKVKVNSALVPNANYILLIIKQLDGVHKNRSFVKYSPRITYNGISVNNECIKKICSFMEWNDNAAWFVSEIDLSEQDTINFIAHKISNNEKQYATVADKIADLNRIVGNKTEIVQQNQDNIEDVDSVDAEIETAGNEEAEYEDVFHYTSLESAIAILTHKKDDSFSFRATRCDCLNDPNEVGETAGGVFDGKDKLPFILSFSTNDDSQLMWRLYNSQIQFQFSRKIIEDEVHSLNKGLKISCKKVNYVDSTEKDFYKHKDWSIESEWRLVAYDRDGVTQPESDLKNTMSKYGLVQLFRSIHIPINSLNGIKILAVNEKQFKIIKRQLFDLLIQVSDNFAEGIITQAECAPFRK